MADEKIQEHDTNRVTQVEREFANRRNVIKGIASAVPVIMTVSSGEALANASAYQCVEKTPYYENTPECITKGKKDNWYRQTAWVDEDGTAVEKECLVYVDQSGNSLHKGAGGRPITHSCYNSFLPYK